MNLKEKLNLTRTQLRFKERIETEAKEAHQHLAEKFMLYLVTCDNVDSEETAKTIIDLSARWKLFCKKKGINTEAYGSIEAFCKHSIDEYHTFKQPKPAPAA